MHLSTKKIRDVFNANGGTFLRLIGRVSPFSKFLHLGDTFPIGSVPVPIYVFDFLDKGCYD